MARGLRFGAGTVLGTTPASRSSSPALVAEFLPQFVESNAGPGALATLAAIQLSVIFAGELLWAPSPAPRARCVGCGTG